MSRVSICALLAVLAGVMPAAEASPIFADGFENCCTVSGNVVGLSGSGLILRLSAGGDTEDLAVGTNGRYAFQSVLDAGTGYDVSVHAQPSGGPDCLVSNASGVMPGVPVTDIDVDCVGSLQWDSGDWGDDWQ